MYSVTKFYDRQMFAFSVPPSVHSDLPEDFQELSRIHFYLGRAPIEHMIKAVENASLKQIFQGKIQLYFAAKEIDEFLSSSSPALETFTEKALNPSLFFQKTFDDILKHAEQIFDNAYKNPAKKNNLIKVETMLDLTHQTFILHQELSKVGITTDIGSIENLKTKYKKLFDLKSHYENLTNLDSFDSYSNKARQSLIKQLNAPYQFNFSEMAKYIYHDRDDWMTTLHVLSEERKKSDNPDYQINEKDTQELKDQFLKQVKSFNSLLKNGVINYIHSFSAAISKEIFITSQKSKISAESYFNQEIGYHKKSLKSYYSKDYHEQKIKELEKIKDKFIQAKIDDKSFYEQYLTILHRQETNISQSLDKIKANLLNINLKDNITFVGDINTGFVVGTFSNSEKVILIHKDNMVSVPEAVSATVLDKQEYNTLLESNQLVFNTEFRDNVFNKSSNFWSYGQFLQEITDPSVQKFFLGQEFDLIDQTSIDLANKKKITRI